ncbi:putative efflux protein, MATE family [Flavobacterium glycines]|uniref:Multidrug-efflux transporter n=1 Tax=Flavobacterium glycines TaxID=551990 RepID=A0A1B9DKT6_9FLAO|nr:MATE family efflux transporter [Flavobacterium glycines]OCB70253.1 MATE family efflux transporter [Flavobacterium glycines]GEL11711.1 MATE family efflux transporter [Flavobacterium glycines]SDJ69395.1 putative efflux protein, MATE family [Flavobacterium glycines]
MSKEKLVDMTRGAITPKIIHYTLPLIIGNFFVLSYNATDSIIVGRYIGANALAALGAASPVMNILLFLIIGICLGMSVLMGQSFGKQDYSKLKRLISTSFIAGGTFTLVLIAFGFVFSRSILLFLNTPLVILDDATSYLQIIFIGLVFSFIYHIYASTLRSMGNSKASLYFLIASALLNVVMDYLFVVEWHKGIEGAAWATVMAEAIAALFCVLYVRFRIPILRFKSKDFVFDKDLLRTIVSYSSVAAMQQITLHLGKFFIQGAVNPLGVVAIAAFNAVTRIDDFVMVVQQNIAHGTTGFIAQNNGKRNFSRISRGFRIGFKMEVVYSVLAMLVVLFFSKELISLFVGEGANDIISEGVKYLRVMVFLYLLPGITNVIQGYFRGLGMMKITLNATFSQMLGRVIAAYFWAPYFGIKGIALACLVGWICMLSYESPLFYKSWKQGK